MVASCAQQFALCIQHVDDIARADIETGLCGLIGLCIGLDRTFQGIYPADPTDNTTVIVTRLAFGGAVLLFLLFQRLVVQ